MAENLIEKISHYNLFNNLFPGVIYVIVVNHFTRLTLPTVNILETFFLSYLIGLVVSRIGSVLVKPYLIEKLPCYPKEVQYNDFIRAVKQDPKIDILSSERNVYRTLIALGVIILATIALDSIAIRLNLSEVEVFIPLVVGLIILFISAYVKQTKFIIKRINKTKK